MPKLTMTLNFEERDADALNEMSRRLGLNKTQIIRQAVRLYQLAHDQQHRIVIESDGPPKTRREVVLLK